MPRALPFIIVGFVAIATIAGGAWLYRARKSPELHQTAARSTSVDKIHLRGNPDAPVTIDEYGDYECPPCGKLAEPLKKLENEYGEKLRVIFHHFPLPMHAHSTEAAHAAEAAGLQGKFWEMHDLLYREQSSWTSTAADARKMFLNYAGMLSLDVDRFARDMDSEAVKERVEQDHEKGEAIGVKATPSLFVNNKYIVPKSEEAAKQLREAIDEALRAKSPP